MSDKESNKPKEEDEGKEQSFLDHIDELRKRIVYALIGVALGCVVSGVYIDEIINGILIKPIKDVNAAALADQEEKSEESSEDENKSYEPISDTVNVNLKDTTKLSLDTLAIDSTKGISESGADNLISQDSSAIENDSAKIARFVSDKSENIKKEAVDSAKIIAEKIKDDISKDVKEAEAKENAEIALLKEQVKNLSRRLDSLDKPLSIQNLKPMGEVFVYFKVIFIVGIIIAFPFVLYQLWKFVAPGLYQNERSWARQITLFTSVCFFSGVAFSYYILIPVMLTFASGFGSDEIKTIIDINEHLSFITMMLLAAGLLFELPVVSLILSRVGILTSQFMRKYRRHAIILILIVAAVITPTPDPITQLTFGLPILVLYEVSIIIVKVSEKKRAAV